MTELHGVVAALSTPFDDTGEALDEAGLRRHLDAMLEAGVHGVVLCAGTGEFAYLSWAQRRRVVEVTLAAAAGRVPVVAGVAATTTAEAVRQAVEFERMGCAGILAILEAYFPVPDAGVVAYFRAIAEALSCPLVLYTNPRFQRSDLSLAAIAERTGLVSFGVVPYFPDAIRLPPEDAMNVARHAPDNTAPIRIAVPVLSRIANFDDLDPLSAEPDVAVTMVPAGETLPGDVDLIVLPGTKATLADLAFLRDQGWDVDIAAHGLFGRHELGSADNFVVTGQ